MRLGISYESSAGQQMIHMKYQSLILHNKAKNLSLIPINATSVELSVFWPSDTENQINELSFFLIPYHYPLKRGLRRLPVFAAMLHNVNFKHGTRNKNMKT